ncbi:hypothetical protein AB1Y20_011233 [Prymnesium parvum]|uniref:DUF5672 domain-containing protein n=1 Tax=Prymnesium parvum TaxID=97485 RepID=A0AB34INZ5_PRYPA
MQGHAEEREAAQFECTRHDEGHARGRAAEIDGEGEGEAAESGPGLVLLYAPPQAAISEQLRSLRCAVHIARALGASLVLPPWYASGAYTPLAEAVDVEALRTLVPLLLAPPAAAWRGEVWRVHIHTASSPPPPPPPDEYFSAAARGAAASISAAVRLRRPWRSAAEIRRALRDAGCDLARRGLLLLPHLPADAASASCSALHAAGRAVCARALATPSARLQRLCGGAASGALCVVVGAPARVAVEAAAARVEALLASGGGAAVRRVWTVTLDMAEGAGGEGRVEGAGEEGAGGEGAAGAAGGVGGVVDRAAVVAELLRARGVDAAPLPVGQLSPLDASFAARWACSVAAMLLLPLRGRGGGEIVAARQALGRPIDHLYFETAGQSAGVTHVAAAEAYVGRGALFAEAGEAILEGVEDAERVEEAHTDAGDAQDDLTSHSKAAGGDKEGRRAPLSHGARTASSEESLEGTERQGREQHILQLFESKLSAHPELRGRILSLHPAAAKFSCLPANSSPVEAYNSFLSRTAPLLRRLPFSPPPVESSHRVAVIVEPRSDPHIVRRTAYVLRNVCACLNPTDRPAEQRWAMQWFHGLTNKELVKAHFDDEEFARLRCVNLGVETLRSSQEYSQLLTSIWFWEQVGSEQVLVFQEDAMLCSTHIERFLKYDYVGAPWPATDRMVCGKPWLEGVGGNGGLSLRRRSQAFECLDVAARQPGQWEDIFFVELLQRLGFQVAPAAVAREFSVEQVFQEKPCGLHKAYNYLTVQQLNTVLCHVEATYRTLANQAQTTKT